MKGEFIIKIVEVMGDLSNVGPIGGQDTVHNLKAIYTGSGSVSLQAVASLQYKCKIS